MKNPRLKDMTGLKFGKVSVIRQAGNAKGGGAIWLCICECGRELFPTGGDLRLEKVKSCKPCSGKLIGMRSIKHGGRGTKLYNIWKAMHQRCVNHNLKGWKNYGGKGIKVCDEWKDFANFKNWAEKNGYTQILSIDRIDGNKGYEPSNCRWATKKIQSSNRDYTYKNKEGILYWHIAESNGITRSAYASRIHAGWSFEDASTWPMFKRRPTISR